MRLPRYACLIPVMLATLVVGLPAEEKTSGAAEEAVGAEDRPVDDPHFPKQEALLRINAPGAWALADTLGRPPRQVVIAVIDTGGGANDRDIQLWTNPTEIADNGIDDDNNGYIDDVHGWDFVENSPNVSAGGGHGTGVARRAASLTDNGRGWASPARSPELMILRVFKKNGEGNLMHIAQAIDYAAQNGAHVINCSFQTPNFFLWDSVLRKAELFNVIVVTSPGKGGRFIENAQDAPYPAAADFDNIVSVAASNLRDEPKGSSNSGPAVTDLYAPGKDPSHAVPYVSSAAAFLISYFPDANYHSVKRWLIDGCEPVEAMEGRALSGGRLDMERSLRLALQEHALAGEGG